LGRVTAMLADRRYATTDTTTIILTLARLTGTTDLTGLRAESLSAPARGMAGDARGVGVVGVAALGAVLTVMAEGSEAAGSEVEGSLVGVALTADADSSAVEVLTAAALAARLEASTAVQFMAVAGSTVTAEAGSTAAVVVDTLAADTAVVADTGKRGLIRSSLIWWATMNGWQRTLPAVSFLPRQVRTSAG
jgi:hypothetical protein